MYKRLRFTEIWKPIPDWPSYLISSLGRVKRLACRGSDGRFLQEKIIKPGITVSGKNHSYKRMAIQLVENNPRRQKGFSIAKLMLLAFVGPPSEGKNYARHLDDDPTNNLLYNLAWGTPKENGEDAVRNGRYNHDPVPESVRLKISKALSGRKVKRNYVYTDAHRAKLRNAKLGSKSPNAKLNEEKVLIIKIEFRTGEKDIRTLSNKYEVSYQTIYDVVMNRTWTHV